MGKIIAGSTMSLDGCINDSTGSVDKLYPDYVEMHDIPSFKEMIQATGAVVMGRRAFAMGSPESWDDYEFQTPIFVLTRRPTSPIRVNKKVTITFVTDGIESAITQARQAAGDKNVQIIGGASTVQQSLNSGLVDELHVDLVPVLLGNGLKLFKHINTQKVAFEKIGVEDVSPVRTSLKFKVVSSA